MCTYESEKWFRSFLCNSAIVYSFLVSSCWRTFNQWLALVFIILNSRLVAAVISNLIITLFQTPLLLLLLCCFFFTKKLLLFFSINNISYIVVFYIFLCKKYRNFNIIKLIRTRTTLITIIISRSLSLQLTSLASKGEQTPECTKE